MKIDIRDLQNNGFIKWPYPAELRQNVVRIFENWKLFCALPSEIKNAFPFNEHDDVGYEFKNGSNKADSNKVDYKENFDLTIAGEQWLNVEAEKTGSPVALDFINGAISLVSVIKPMAFDFAGSVEQEFGLTGFKQEIEDSEHKFYIRFLHYFGERQPGQVIAAEHADQSGFTLHLFSSSPGLQGLSLDGEWFDLEVNEGQTVIFPAMQLQLLSGGKLKALCHRVIATKETAQVDRYSAVCFVQFKGMRKYDKAAHGSMQGHKPGFNYSIPHQDFQKLFMN